ncbi:MAG: hypothetical protein HYX41_04700 [Bdellovibrio sp.]|nr:hypothetical protein [Bdellovibrio sp.]
MILSAYLPIPRTLGSLKFVPALADWVGSDAHPDRLGNSFVYAIFLDRKEIAEAEENWLLPKGDLNVQIYSKGESFHPRLKGILAPKGEYGLRGIGKFSGQENPQVLEKASIALLGEFARRIQTAEWIYVDGKVVQGPQESVLVQQGLQDLGAITELMKDSANHPAILKSLLKSRR